MIKSMISDLSEDVMTQPIPIPNVTAAVLRKVVEWCAHHRDDPVESIDDDSDAFEKAVEIDEWDQNFFLVEQNVLFDIIVVRTIPVIAASRSSIKNQR